MSFKNSIRWILSLAMLASVSASLIGCSDFLKGKKKEEEVIELSDAKFDYLKEIPANIRKFAAGEVSQEEIDKSFDSLQKALIYFSDRTVGSSSSAYSVEDIRSFFGRYFLKENNISPETAVELMKLKKALFGGSDTLVTKEEIKKIVDVLGILRSEVAQVNPYVKTILLKKQDASAKEAVPWQEVDESVEHLREGLKHLLASSELAKSDYTFEDVKHLVAGISEFAAGSTSSAVFSKFNEYVPLLESVKVVLLGKKATLNGLGDWNLALNNFVDLYGVFLKFHYVVTQQKLDTPNEINQLTKFGSQVFQLVNGSFQMTKTGQIPLEDIDDLIAQVAQKFPIPLGLTAESLQKTYKVIIVNVLDPVRGGESRGLYALTQAHLASLRRELNIWRLGQSFVNRLNYNANGFIGRAELLKAYDQYDYAQVIRVGLEKNSLEQSALETSWKDLGVLLKTDRPVNFTSQGRYVVSGGQNVLPMNWKALTKFNFERSLTRILMLGYSDANSLNMAKGAVSMNSLIKWYDDFRAIGLELKAFDPRSANSGKRSFQEANFFTFSGNGDDRMDFKESFEFVSILFSAGLSSSNKIRTGLQAAGCEAEKVDVFGFKMFNENLLKEDLHKNFAVYFNNLPGMTKYVEEMSPEQWDSFYLNLMSATRVSPASGGVVEMADLRTFVVVLHYIETIFTIYDKDANQNLSLAEIEAAAPRFLSFLRTVSPGTSDANLTDAFSYLVAYGAKPSSWDVAKFKVSKVFSYPNVTRANIVQVFKSLKEDLIKPAK